MTDRRSMPRFALGLACSVRLRGDVARAAQLIDVSLSGCRIEALSRMHAGDLVWMTIGTVRGVTGTVVWASGDFAGIRFGEPLHLSIVDDLIIRAGSTADEATTLADLARRSEWQVVRTHDPVEVDELLSLAQQCRSLGPASPPSFDPAGAYMEP